MKNKLRTLTDKIITGLTACFIYLTLLSMNLQCKPATHELKQHKNCSSYIVLKHHYKLLMHIACVESV